MMARYGQLSGLAASGVGSVPETHSPLFPRDLLSSPAQMGYRSPLEISSFMLHNPAVSEAQTGAAD
ncbi:hypothetical protein PAMP_024449 [Pampus punctatissimus]